MVAAMLSSTGESGNGYGSGGCDSLKFNCFGSTGALITMREGYPHSSHQNPGYNRQQAIMVLLKAAQKVSWILNFVVYNNYNGKLLHASLAGFDSNLGPVPIGLPMQTAKGDCLWKSSSIGNTSSPCVLYLNLFQISLVCYFIMIV